MDGVGLSVLYVCTGNVCRSPAAQTLLRSWSGRDSGVTVASAGTGALAGAPIDAVTAAVLEGLGVDPSGHRARQFQPRMAAEADLVLTAELRHRDLVLMQVPLALRRTFTMKEFARLAGHLDRTDVPSTDPVATIAGLARLRHLDGPLVEGTDDVADPYRRGVEAADLAVQEIAATVRATISALGLRTLQPQAADPDAPADRDPRSP